GWALAPESTNGNLTQVSGQVSCAGQPVSGMIFFLTDQPGTPHAIGPMKPDGSFQLYCDGKWDRPGAVAGTYRVVVRPRSTDETGPRVDGKYQDLRTTDLVVRVGPEWNHVRIDLR